MKTKTVEEIANEYAGDANYNSLLSDIKSYAQEKCREQRETEEDRKKIVLKLNPELLTREFIHSPAEEISIIMDSYEASCPLERREIIEEIDARFIDIMVPLVTNKK